MFEDLQEKAALFLSLEKHVVVCFNETKVQKDLVWDKHTNELIGFVDLGNTEVNYATLVKSDDLASSILVFLIRSLHNPLSFSVATFATKSITSYQLFLLFWKAVSILELTCQLKVIASTADGASPNRSFVKIHRVKCFVKF